MIRLRRRYVSGGFLILSVMALCSLYQQKLSSADQNGANNPNEPKWQLDRALTLTPRSEPVPVLRYQLFPLASELKEGNAVPIYLRLVHERNDETKREWKEKAAEWNKLPLDQLPVQEARKFFEKYAYMMRQLEFGARRKTAEWNYTLDAGDPIGLLLPDAQYMRTYGALRVLKARMELA